MPFSQYIALPQSEQGDYGEANGITREPPLRPTSEQPTRRLGVLYLCLSVSILANVAQFVSYFVHFPVTNISGGLQKSASEGICSVPSANMGLVRNLSKPLAHSAAFHQTESHNTSSLNDVFESRDFDPNLSYVAIDLEWAASKGIPPAQPWPWDENKGIYFVQGMHLIHCTKMFHEVLGHFYDGKPLRWPRHHIEHCVHVLREEIMCNANDELMYTGRVNGQENVKHPIAGADQPRLCRDWSQLLGWITERSACYWNIEPTGPDFHESERYKFCPDGKKYWD